MKPLQFLVLFTALVLAACGDHLTDIRYGAVAAEGDSTPDLPGDPNGPEAVNTTSACTQNGFQPTAQNTARFDPSITSRQALQALDARGGILIFDNYPRLPGGVPAGSTGIVTLDARAGGKDCGLCLRGTTIQDGNFKVKSGQAEFTAPTATGQPLTVTLRNVVLTADTAPARTWCIESVTLTVPTTPWSCEQLNLGFANGCYRDSKAGAAAVAECDNGTAVRATNCAALNQTCFEGATYCSPNVNGFFQ